MKMAIAYSQDLRKRALSLLEKDLSITQVSRLLEISRPTLYKWQNQFQTTGSIKPLTPVRSSSSSHIKNWGKFQEFVDFYGDKTQSEMAELWSIEIGKKVSHDTISRGLKKLGYTRKKKPLLILSG